MTPAKNTQSVASYDNAPFFEKAFRHAVQHGLINQARVDEIINDAATGSLQITEYFAESTHLRKNLEASMKRMVSLVSLYLEDTTDGELDRAAQLLKEKPFRALSRGGSQMLKALYSMPEDDHFGSPRLNSEREFLKKCLIKGVPVAKFRQTFIDCERFKRNIDFATLLAKKIGAPINQLNEMHASAEHVIRTVLLSLAYSTKKVASNKSGFPDEAGLFDIFTSIRKEYGFLGDVTCRTKFIDDLPAEFQGYAKAVLTSVKNDDVPKVTNQSVALESVLNDLKDRKYFYLHDQLNDVSRFDKMLAVDWFALTGGTEEDSLLLTLFLCAAAGIDQKTMLRVSEAKKAVLNIRENGLLQNEVLNLIKKAPHEEIEQLRSLWADFIEEATPYLLDRSDEKLNEVLMYLSERCNIQKAK
ncbi:hypothetical protein [Methylotenera sp.]|uniref:hypothetical protein n=1 Tax=Methylotenera sp. TaxID=2051956 RepID=UPI00271D88AA|nr:hypothetical protein [Methylotenera sp.]MDO9204423.1 hypothetical protein [Methylotenera sp.]